SQEQTNSIGRSGIALLVLAALTAADGAAIMVKDWAGGHGDYAVGTAQRERRAVAAGARPAAALPARGVARSRRRRRVRPRPCRRPRRRDPGVRRPLRSRGIRRRARAGGTTRRRAPGFLCRHGG